MITELSIINACLATMGELPLNSALDTHPHKGAIQALLSEKLLEVQAKGHWFNTETLTLTPDSTKQIYLPGDYIKWQSGGLTSDLLMRMEAQPWLVARGARLYDTRYSTYEIDRPVSGSIVRNLPIDQLPFTAASLVSAKVVLQFQANFDADPARTDRLTRSVAQAQVMFNAEATRMADVNLLNANPRLQRIKSVVRQSRGR